ncbi:hypothetical protein V6Z11_A12G188800 [Gossypium hirsutum]
MTFILSRKVRSRSKSFARIKTLCALLEASGTCIPEAEKTNVMLAGLPFDFDAVVSSVSVSFESVPFQRLVDALVECENRQLRTVQEVPMHANLVDGAPSPALEGSVCSGRPPSGGRERGFRLRIQWQICNKFGHLA